MSEDIGGFLPLPKNIPKNYLQLSYPVQDTEEVKTVRPLGHLLLSPKVRVLKIQGPYRDR